MSKFFEQLNNEGNNCVIKGGCERLLGNEKLVLLINATFLEKEWGNLFREGATTKKQKTAIPWKTDSMADTYFKREVELMKGNFRIPESINSCQKYFLQKMKIQLKTRLFMLLRSKEDRKCSWRTIIKVKKKLLTENIDNSKRSAVLNILKFFKKKIQFVYLYS